jgi:class 3 adenylate cyclase/tetratricopeptide (TPR) repeat protein
MICATCGHDNAPDARFCSDCGVPIGDDHPSREVRKVVTVVFTDLVDSTGLGERLDPESLRRVMSRYFDAMQAILERHGGTVEKFIGDAIMAVFGIPAVHEDDALRAVRAAVDMADELVRLNEELGRDYGVRLEIRAGINTGEVVAGETSARQKLATGDAVNVAARLEQVAGPGTILLGDETYRLARDSVLAERLQPLTLKGKSEPLHAWRMIELLPEVSAFTRAIAAPFVGRTEELAALEQAFQTAVRDAVCRLATVVGPPGIGKSRLARELIAAVAGKARVVVGRCLPYGDGITYWPLAEIVRQIAGADPQQRLAELVAESDRAPLVVARITGAVGALDGAGAGSPEETAWAFRKLFEALARRRPLVIVADDIHWAEPTLLDLLEYLVSFSSGAPILLLCLARPDLFDLRPSWAAPRPNTTIVPLAPLSGAETQSLVNGLVQQDELSNLARSRIVEAAEGNPLFVEQMLAMQSEDPAQEVVVPPTIQALLAARIDRLDPDERSVLERASVEGRMFHRGAVAELLPEQARRGIGAQLMSLIRKEFLRPDRTLFPGDDGFRFNHILIRDAAYGAMPKQLRAEMHERYADWLEQRIQGDDTDYEEILGYHLSQAYQYQAELGSIGDRGPALASRAVKHLTAAGRRASARLDPSAVTLLDQAIRFLPADDADRGTILLELADSLYEAGEMHRADEALTEAIRVCESSGDMALSQQARLKRGQYRFTTGFEAPTAAQLLKQAASSIEVFEQPTNDRALALAFHVMGDAYWSLGRMAAALEVSERSLPHAERSGDSHLVDACTSYVFQTMVLGPTPLEETLARAEGLCQILFAHRIFEWDCAVNNAWALGLLGRFNEARAALAGAEQILRDLGSSRELASLWYVAGMVAWWEGDLLVAEAKVREAFDAWYRRGELRNAGTTATELARIVYDLVQYDEAYGLTGRAREMTFSDDLEAQISWRGPRARVLARRGAFEEAGALVREARGMVEGTDFLNLQGDVAMDLAEVSRLAGRIDEAASAAGEALRRYERKGSIVLASRARDFLRELAT